MNLLLALVIGILYASGTYLLLRRSLVKLIIGISMLGHGTNLLIFTVGRSSRPSTYREPPLIAEGAYKLAGNYTDPLPQALILTAIVIGFGVLAFTLMLIRETARTSQTGDVNDLVLTDEPPV